MRFRRYRYEPLVLVLVALAALPPISLTGPQDHTRIELTRHVVLFHTIRLENTLFDRALYHGKTYSDKAPGMSFLAIPAFELERGLGIAKPTTRWNAEGDVSLWLLRVLTSGVLFLVAVFVVGRLAEGIAPGTGAVTASLFGVATMAAPLAPTLFEHDAAGAFGISAFALLWLGRSNRALVAAGLAAGTAVVFNYQSAIVVLALTGYAAWRVRRRVLWFLAGGVPPAIALGAYDWAAFGSPFHLSYSYVANAYTEKQHAGLFGIGAPTLDGLRDVLVGSRGLLVWSPVCVAAAVGLVLLWRRGSRAEALTAGAIVVAFAVADAGYFLPYGGGSPGPRFMGASLPFLALGLAPALARLRLPVLALGLLSVFTMTVQALSWGVRSERATSYLPTKNDVMSTIWMQMGAHRDLGAALVLVCALAAFGVGARAAVRR
ncbi:MAG TPA: hypothetical protein VFA56_09715 [Gaiellaceae bacterium]|nr:hypothetical protein [Gaiellaceae bacterium]